MIFTQILLCIFFIIGFPAVILFIQSFLALFANNKSIKFTLNKSLKTTILIPAHNESKGIIQTLENLLAQLKPQDSILVVADNCTDDTAEVARAHGVEVVERFDGNNRGKGFALDFGLRQIESSNNLPDVLVIVDADCLVSEGGLQKLANYSYQLNLPVQALYLMKNIQPSGFQVQISEFAWLLKNKVRPLGYYLFDLPCQLMGTGMAFPWNLISKSQLANGNIVEDMKLGIDLAVDGKGARFFPFIEVTSYFPNTQEARVKQSTRWEHGHLGMIIAEFPRLMITGIKKFDFRAIFLAFDLVIPPLALYLVVIIFQLFIGLVIASVINKMQLAYLVMTTTFIFFSAVLLAWVGFGRNVLEVRSILAIPKYVFKKIPNYLRFLYKREKSWIRTDRD